MGGAPGRRCGRERGGGRKWVMFWSPCWLTKDRERLVWRGQLQANVAPCCSGTRYLPADSAGSPEEGTLHRQIRARIQVGVCGAEGQEHRRS